MLAIQRQTVVNLGGVGLDCEMGEWVAEHDRVVNWSGGVVECSQHGGNHCTTVSSRIAPWIT